MRACVRACVRVCVCVCVCARVRARTRARAHLCDQVKRQLLIQDQLQASDDMCEACDLVALPWLLRRAIGFVNDLELLDDEEVFQTKLKAAGVLDIVETVCACCSQQVSSYPACSHALLQYPWSGAEVQHKRRDKRKGSHRGRVVSTPAGPSIQCAQSSCCCKVLLCA